MIKKQSSVANTATLRWPLFFFFCAAGGFCRQLFFGHFIFSEDPHGLRNGKLEWMSQTPTVVLVLLNLRHCTIQCTGFGSCFSHFYIGNKRHDSAYETIQKQTKKNASNRKISPPLIILHDGKASMHDIKSATLTMFFVFFKWACGRCEKKVTQPSTAVSFVQIKSF